MFSTVFEKIGEITPVAWGTLLCLLLIGVALFALSRHRKQWTARMIANAALCIALSFVLSCVRIYHMPQGGSITPASMLPLIAFGYLYGAVPGLIAGTAYGLLQFLQDAYFVHPIQLLLDYVLAFGVLSIASFFRKLPEFYGLPLGIFVACCARLLCSMVSGAVFFAEYAGGQNPWIYSLAYNASYMIPEALICVAIACIPATRTTLHRLTSV